MPHGFAAVFGPQLPLSQGRPEATSESIGHSERLRNHSVRSGQCPELNRERCFHHEKGHCWHRRHHTTTGPIQCYMSARISPRDVTSTRADTGGGEIEPPEIRPFRDSAPAQYFTSARSAHDATAPDAERPPATN